MQITTDIILPILVYIGMSERNIRFLVFFIPT